MNDNRQISASRLHSAFGILILAVVALTALAHPLCLSDSLIAGLYKKLPVAGLFQQMSPWITCGYSPLVLKNSFFLSVTAALLFVFTWIKVRSQWLGQETSAFGDSRNWQSVLAAPEFWGICVLLYFAVTVAWSEVFQQSLQTWVLLASGAALFILIRSSAFVHPRRFAVKFMVLCLVCGAVLAVIALLQHLDSCDFLPKLRDPRNRMSSLIGHNTGLSSWLMFPLSFSLYFMLTNRRIWVRILAAILVALFVLVIIAAESRAVWALALLIILLVPWKIIGISRKRFSIKWIIASIALVFALIVGLTSSPQTNPLARLPVSLTERVTGHIFNLDQLRRETRLRILVVSLTKIFPRSPVFGTGLGSFSWVYPKAQGDYFSDHPDSKLGTTTRRTAMAHNDYLQVLTDTGLFGLMLVLAGMACVGRAGIIALRDMESPYDRAKWWALVAPSVGVLLQATVDFPLHVAPIAVVTIITTGLATRLSTPIPPTAPLSNRNYRVATGVGLAAALMIFSWLPWSWQALVGRELISNSYYNAGDTWLKKYASSEGETINTRLGMLERARRSFRESTVSDVFNGQAYEGQATACVNRAAFMLDQLDTLPADMATTAAEPIRIQINRDASSAITNLENQLKSGGLRYHFTWYLLGRSWRMLWELEKDSVAPEDSKAYHEAVSNLRKAIRYNPVDAASIRELSELLALSQSSTNESNELRNRLFDVEPWQADELMLQPAIKLATEGEIPTAQAMLDPIFEEVPDNPRVMLAKVWLAYYQAVWPPEAIDKLSRDDEYLQWRREHLDKARGTLARIPDTDFTTPQKQRLEMLYAAASEDIHLANQLSKARLDVNMWDREARSIFYWTQHELYGGALKSENSIDYYRTNGLLTIYFMTKRQLGLNLGELATREKLTLPEARRLIAFIKANDWWDFLRLFLPALRKDYPGDEALRELSTELEQH